MLTYFHPGDDTLKLAACSDSNCASAEVNNIGGSNGAGSDHDLAIGTNGLPIIAFVHPSSSELRVIACADSECSTGSFNVVAGSVSGDGDGLSMAIGVDGLPVISFRSNDALQVAACSDPACSNAQINQVDDGGQHSSIVIGVTAGGPGLPLISYRGPDDMLWVAACTQSDCSNAIVNHHSGGASPIEATSITVNRVGRPAVLYRIGGASGSTRLLTCEASCSSSIANQLLSSTAIDSMAFNRQGLPVTSTGTTVGLSLLFCENSECSDRHTLNEIGGNSPVTSAMTLRADGRPIIAYRNDNDGHLEVFDCANELCSPYFRQR